MACVGFGCGPCGGGNYYNNCNSNCNDGFCNGAYKNGLAAANRNSFGKRKEIFYAKEDCFGCNDGAIVADNAGANCNGFNNSCNSNCNGGCFGGGFDGGCGPIGGCGPVGECGPVGCGVEPCLAEGPGYGQGYGVGPGYGPGYGQGARYGPGYGAGQGYGRRGYNRGYGAPQGKLSRNLGHNNHKKH